MEGQDKKDKRALSLGGRVQLHSLLRLPELNGAYGKIVKPQDPSTGRLGVEIENKRVLALLPSNVARLCDCADCCIQLHRPILRCAQCKIAAYCSKTCQSKAWKAGHKRECVNRASVQAEAYKAPPATTTTKLTADQMNKLNKVRNKNAVRSLLLLFKE